MKKEWTKRFAVICAVALLAALTVPVLAGDQPKAKESAPAAEPPALTPEDAAAPQEPRNDEPAPVVEDAEPRLFEAPEDLFGPDPAPATCCVDECRRDKQCDSVCGAPGAGVCIQVNSCCRECACTF